MATLLLKTSSLTERVVIPRIESDEGEGALEGIRCPKCTWRPMRSDLWSCSAFDTPEPPFDFCMTEWNTFTTRGRCPGCQHQWLWTSCLCCGQWSLHEDWYERPAPPH